jgi:hypothetical protein
MLLDGCVTRKLRDQVSHWIYTVEGITLVHDGEHRGTAKSRPGPYRFEFHADRIYSVLGEEVRPIRKQSILFPIEFLAIAR